MSVPLPDFSIPHREKIEWMVETHGWALEPVAARPELEPPMPGYAYTIGFPAAFGFPEVVLFGLTPAASNGLLTLVADVLRGGTEVALGVELVGLLDNGLRCVFAPIELTDWAPLFDTARAWHGETPFDVVQLMWPDRQGFLPYEAGFDERLLFAQPVVGEFLS